MAVYYVDGRYYVEGRYYERIGRRHFRAREVVVYEHRGRTTEMTGLTTGATDLSTHRPGA